MMTAARGEVEVCGWGRKHIVTLNMSGGYTVIKRSEVIQRAASLWGWTVCSAPTRFTPPEYY